MTAQMSIFDIPETNESLFKEKLTPRQWRLHGLLLDATAKRKKLTLKQMLERMDAEYGYSQERAEAPKRAFADLGSRRELSKDLLSLRKSKTPQHVYVGGRYALSEQEAEDYLLRDKISTLDQLKTVWNQIRKLSLDGQMRLVFGKERDHIEAIVRISEPELAEGEE